MSSYKRTFKRSTKRAVSTMLVTAMCLSGGAAVFAEEAPATTVTTSTASALIFNDVNDGFWAEKHIYKLAAEGIILGDAGKFRPSDSVTQQEAITMAVRFMNLESKLGNGAGAPEEMKVGGYFKPYLELALSQNLIDKTEELSSTKAGESWGAKTATREWIAKLLVRALGEESKAKAAGSAATGFADHTSISPAARGYVNVAVQLELTKGVEGNRFDPLGKVTRAQLATFFSRGSEYATPGYSNVYEGIVTELTDSKLTLFTNGQLKSFALDNRSVYFTKDSEAKSSRNAIQLYTKVLAVDKIGSAAYVEVRDASQQLEKTEGTLLKKLSDQRLLMLVNNNAVEYTYDSSTSFLDQNGNAISAESLTEDSTIIVQRETFTAAKKPVIVQVKSGVVNKSGTGTVDLVSVTDKSIRIKDDATGTIETYKYDDTSILIYQNQLLGGAAELQAGAAVTYTVKNSVFTRLEVTKAMERTVKGTLLSVEGTTLLSFTNSGGKAEIKALAAKPVVVVNGIADATLEDLIADVNGGDQVELTISPEEQVTKIVVTGRQSELLTDLSVVKYESKYKALMVVDSAKKVHAFTVDDKTKAEYNTTTPTLTGVESLLTEGRKLNVTVIGNRVLAIQVMYKYEGTYVSTDTAAKKVTILLSNGKTVTVPYQGASPSIELYGKPSATIADLKVGDPVTAILTANQDSLQTLAVRKTVQFNISSVNLSNSRIQASSNGVTDTFYVDKATLLNDSGAAITVSSLQAGQTINVTFNGRTAASLQVVKLTLGKVTAIDASSITVKSFSGSSDVYPLGSGVKVIRGTAVSSGTASLTTSDHVELSKDVDGTLQIKVLSSLERKFQRYDTINNDILVYRATIQDDNFRFDVSPNLYIHQGDTTLTVQSLKDNDKIVLYFNGDKLVEVEKQ